MRFALAGIDRYIGVFEALVQAGWTPVKAFTAPVANRIDDHKRIVEFAERHQIDLQTAPISDADLQALQEHGCDALVVACYPWRIGHWEPCLTYAVNFHCSPLPEGRGPYPLHRAILEQRSAWAVTCHRIAPAIDAGDILAAEHFPLSPDECHESLDLKIQMAALCLAGRIARGLPQFWAEARPQGAGTSWPYATLQDRIIHFNDSVESILRHIRAFGATESLAEIRGTWLGIKRAVGWSALHHRASGQVLHIHNQTIVVAARDGCIALLEADLARPDVVARLRSRS